MTNRAILKLDFLINRRSIQKIWLLQLISLLTAAIIRGMGLTQVSDMFWDTIPVVILPTVLMFWLAYTVVKRSEDDKTMAFLMATQNSPGMIIGTKAMFLLINSFFLMAASMGFGLVTRVYDLMGTWTQDTYVLLNLGSFCLQVFVGGFCFFVSCASIYRKKFFYFKVAGLFLGVEYLIYLVWFLNPELAVFEYLSVFSLFQQQMYCSGSMVNLLTSLILVVAGTGLYLGGRHSFCNRSLRS